jgi:hypothetical protein
MSEILTQDEIDELINGTKEIDTTIPFSSFNPAASQAVSTAKTMLKRYYYTLTHCSYEEQRVAKRNLREAAFKVWLNRYGFEHKSDYIDFINNEIKKRGLDWKLYIR